MKKIISLTLLILVLTSCAGIRKKNQTEPGQIANKEQIAEQSVGEYAVVESESEAAMLNQRAEAAIQEVEVSDRVYFGLNQSSLSDEAKKTMDTQISWLNSDPSINIIIEGHCDERGTREYNIALGEKRANSAKQYLIQGGISAQRIKTISYGKERPAFVGSGEEIWSKNRRAVTVIAE